MTICLKIASILLGYLLVSSSAFAGWEIQTQKADGSWRTAKTGLPTETRAHSEAKIACSRSTYQQKIIFQLKIIETATGKEYKLYCDPKTGRLSDSGKPVLLTEQEAIEKAKLVKKQCLSNSFMQSMLDCGCVENKAKAELLQSEAHISLDAVLRKVSNPPINTECVNRKGAYEYTYNACVPVMKSRHPDDAEQFCGCAADETAADFVKDPTFNLGHYERLRNAAFKQCGIEKLNKRPPTS